MLRSVLQKTVRDQRRALTGWGIGILGLLLMMLSFYPSIRDQGEEMQKLIEQYPPAMKAFFGEFSDITTGPGYLSAELFSFMLPLLFLIYGIGRGADLIAGEEERGALDVLLAEPVPRVRVLLEKAGGLLLALAGLGALCWVVLAVGDAALGMDVGAGRLAMETLMLVLFAWVGASLALALGAARGRRGLAIGVASAVLVASYLVTALSRLVDGLDALNALSPFHHLHAGEALRGTVPWAGALVLLLLTPALLGLAAWAFERRDVGV